MNIKRTNKLKRNTSGYGHIEMLLLVVAVVVIGGVGFFVYQNQNNKTAKAHAGGYTTLGSSSGITASACKTYNSIYGGIYSIKVLFIKEASTPAYNYDVFDINELNGAYSQRTTSNAYNAGTLAAVSINMSVVNKDIVVINLGRNVVGYEIIPGTGNGDYAKGIDNITDC